MDRAMERIRVQSLGIKRHLVKECKDGTLVVPVISFELVWQLFNLVQKTEEVLLHYDCTLSQPRFLKGYIIQGTQLGNNDRKLSFRCHLLLYRKPYFGGIILFGDNIHFP